jgi:hypothetical protein
LLQSSGRESPAIDRYYFLAWRKFGIEGRREEPNFSDGSVIFHEQTERKVCVDCFAHGRFFVTARLVSVNELPSALGDAVKIGVR